jgi:hypothetical protein
MKLGTKLARKVSLAVLLNLMNCESDIHYGTWLMFVMGFLRKPILCGKMASAQR